MSAKWLADLSCISEACLYNVKCINSRIPEHYLKAAIEQ